MILLDLFCGAGGASAGYKSAGFDCIVGVDNKPQPNYPFAFIEGDAIDYCERFGNLYDAVHASPPCQRYCPLTRQAGSHLNHPDLIEDARRVLVGSGRPYVIENVVGAPLVNPVTLCGSMFGLMLRRHRLFETSFPVPPPPPCRHGGRVFGVYGNTGGISLRGLMRGDGNATRRGTHGDWQVAMGIDWMTVKELSQAIPPSYTRWVGEHLLAAAASVSGK